MDLRKIKTLIELVEHSGITEIEVREGEESVRISRNTGTPLVAPAALPAPQYLPTPVVSATPAASPAPVPAAAADSTHYIVRSPMVGTFYRAPSPTEKPFADVGQAVAVGQTLCIVEAMKMLNQIDSDKAGTIVEIFVENGQSVEFDQPLFALDPA
ncbi:MAG: acetyl-CoA carboxylase biotin carboxyl carrier protein [Nevskiaceae bacterium]|nr:MAG: acetyl-CoA carboxylase biotin carboxyl carrier protein [Nevskiaceae bacterium]TBR73025.1 MAG: acetyl-CoA carboxylase biotin carboxyl carrier protein [Nevskiaceae bacterium]